MVAVEKISLLIVDDHPVVRAGLRTLLRTQLDMEVVGEAVDGASAVEGALALKPDVAIMDLSMEGMGGLEATREIRRQLPGTKVLVLTMHENEEYLRQTLDAGATGYVLKKAANTELAVAIRAVHRGEVFVYPSLTRVLMGDMLPNGVRGRRLEEPSIDLLSDRERQVLGLVARGYSSRQIAEQLYLSVRTIETYRSRLMEKLNLTSRVSLVRYALRNGLLDDELLDR